MKKIVLILILIILLVPSVFALTVTKTAPREISLEDILEVKIIISNDNVARTIKIEEEIRNVDAIKPTETKTRKSGIFSISYYEWTSNLEPNAKEVIIYKIKPKVLGEYISPQTKITDNVGNVFFSEFLVVKINCKSDEICNIEAGENSKNCAEDCEGGIEDGYCDELSDGICDPDCERRADPDCGIKWWVWASIGVGIIVILILLMIYFKRRK